MLLSRHAHLAAVGQPRVFFLPCDWSFEWLSLANILPVKHVLNEAKMQMTNHVQHRVYDPKGLNLLQKGMF